MDYNEKLKEAMSLVGNRQFEEAVESYKAIMAETEGTDIYFWALKHFGDLVGYVGYKDYFQSIDIYQKIITEYEGEDDALYELTQLDVARAYLEMGLEMIGNFESTIQIFEPQHETMIAYQKELIARRNQFIESEAETIFKNRL